MTCGLAFCVQPFYPAQSLKNAKTLGSDKQLYFFCHHVSGFSTAMLINVANPDYNVVFNDITLT